MSSGKWLVISRGTADTRGTMRPMAGMASYHTFERIGGKAPRHWLIFLCKSASYAAQFRHSNVDPSVEITRFKTWTEAKAFIDQQKISRFKG